MDMVEEFPTLGAIVSDTKPTVAPKREPLEGQYVLLKPMVEADFEPLWSAVGAHTDLWKYWPGGPYTESSKFIDGLKEFLAYDALITYTVFRRGEAAGYAFLLPADLDSRVMEAGMVYGPSLQRTREGTETFYLLASTTFDKLNNRRMEWKTDKMNQPSQRAAQRFGLVYEGCLRQHQIQHGRNRDTVWLSMIDSEWPVCKRALELWLNEANFDEYGAQRKRLVEIRQSLAE